MMNTDSRELSTQTAENKERPAPSKKRRGEVHTITERCKGCSFCVEFCPPDILELGSKFNAKGYRYPVVVKPELCTACQLCYLVCPEFAIFVTEHNAKENC